jgi:ribosomal protein L7/L12
LEEKHSQAISQLEKQTQEKISTQAKRHAEELKERLAKAKEEFELEKASLVAAASSGGDSNAAASQMQETVEKYKALLEKDAQEVAVIKVSRFLFLGSVTYFLL